MNDQQFDRELASFLRWQAQQTVTAPSAMDAATTIAQRLSGTRTRRVRLVAAMAFALAAALVALLLLFAVGSHLPNRRLTNGLIVYQENNCEVFGVSAEGALAEPLIPGPSACSVRDPIALTVTYESTAGSANGSVLAISRVVDCGPCPLEPSAGELSSQGVYVLDSVIGQATRVDECPAIHCWLRHVAVSPDGSRVAYTQGSQTDPTGAQTVVIVDRRDGRRTSIDVPRTIDAMAFSPDGEHVAAVTTGPAIAYGDGRLTVSIIGPGARDVVLPAGLDVLGAMTWAPDGRSILVAGATDSDVSPVSVVAVGLDGWVASIDRVDTDVSRVALSASGKLAWYASGADRDQLWVRDRPGGLSVQVMLPDAALRVLGVPLWSPDEALLLVIASRQPPSDSRLPSGSWWLIDPATAVATRVHDIGYGLYDPNPASSPTYLLGWLPGQPADGTSGSEAP